MEIRLIELLSEIKTLILGKVNERWLTLKEVSDYASVSESIIRRAIVKGNLKSSKVTGLSNSRVLLLDVTLYIIHYYLLIGTIGLEPTTSTMSR